MFPLPLDAAVAVGILWLTRGETPRGAWVTDRRYAGGALPRARPSWPGVATGVGLAAWLGLAGGAGAQEQAGAAALTLEDDHKSAATPRAALALPVAAGGGG